MIIFSCKDESLTSFFNSTILYDFPNSHYKYYIIIPYAGCPGCTTEAENYLLRNSKKDDALFVITNFSSLKALTLKLGDSIINNRNVVLDSRNKYFAKTHSECIYPITLSLIMNKIEKVSIGLPAE
jgi:hypothetical protein